jgi:hypothetical protein
MKIAAPNPGPIADTQTWRHSGSNPVSFFLLIPAVRPLQFNPRDSILPRHSMLAADRVFECRMSAT